MSTEAGDSTRGVQVKKNRQLSTLPLTQNSRNSILFYFIFCFIIFFWTCRRRPPGSLAGQAAAGAGGGHRGGPPVLRAAHRPPPRPGLALALPAPTPPGPNCGVGAFPGPAWFPKCAQAIVTGHHSNGPREATTQRLVFGFNDPPMEANPEPYHFLPGIFFCFAKVVV